MTHDKQHLPYTFAKKYGILVAPSEEYTDVYYCEPPSLSCLCEIQRVFSNPIRINVIAADEFAEQQRQIYETNQFKAADALIDLEKDERYGALVKALPQSQDLLEDQDDAPAIKLLNALLTQAINEQVSDIHLETFEESLVVRMRIDGLLKVVLTVPSAVSPMLTTRIKVMAKLDIAEKRLPQDGRLSIALGQHAVDVRVSTLPSNHGERIVLRILDKQASVLDIQQLGLNAKQLNTCEYFLRQSHGIILVTGPTGSGKTTTLYGMLNALNHDAINVLTIEDPVEYDLPGIGQTQVNHKIDMSFAVGLRAILRQDPDIIMIGEIRDIETANIAIQASLTGHLVLSTLHTNTALSAVCRLRDMGIEPFLLSTSLLGLMAQRLVRRLCPHCKQAYDANAEEVSIIGKPCQLYKAIGCEHCQHGYRGRLGIFEIIKIDEALAHLIQIGESERQMQAAISKDYPSMLIDGINKTLAGETTLSEILRVCNTAI